MKFRFFAIAGFAATLAASAPAAPIIFNAFLDGPSESPANASPATGFTTVTIDPVAHTMRVQVAFPVARGIGA